MLLAIHMTGTAEALALGVANGLDPTVLSEIMKRSSGGNWSLNVYNPYPGVMEGVPASRGYSGGFLVDLMIKDLASRWMPLTAPIWRFRWARSRAICIGLLKQQHGAGALDFSSIQRLYLPKSPPNG